MSNKKDVLVQVWMTQTMKEMLDALCKRGGDEKPAALVRGLISSKFEKTFPKYAEKAKTKMAPMIPSLELSPEQKCELAGGKVDTVNGVKMCVIQISPSMKRKVPMSAIESGAVKLD